MNCNLNHFVLAASSSFQFLVLTCFLCQHVSAFSHTMMLLANNPPSCRGALPLPRDCSRDLHAGFWVQPVAFMRCANVSFWMISMFWLIEIWKKKNNILSKICCLSKNHSFVGECPLKCKCGDADRGRSTEVETAGTLLSTLAGEMYIRYLQGNTYEYKVDVCRW